MEEIINNLDILNYDDKQILIRAMQSHMDIKILQTMSIFSQLGNFKNIDEYEYFETNSEEEIFYSKINNYDIFFDKNKKIIYPSRYFFSLDIDLFINHLKIILNMFNNLDLNSSNIKYIGNNIISIEKWFMTYGHFMDEIYILSDFNEKIEKKTNEKFICLNSYCETSNINYNKDNYDKLSKYLFNNCINPYSFNEDILRMTNVKLIIHNTQHKYLNTFHSFPKNIRDKVYEKCNEIVYKNQTKIEIHKNIFISRGIATHMPRNLYNQKEIEVFLSDNNYTLINPENVSLEIFINTIKEADNIFITWGGALVNMVYLKPKTNVIILKSKSYIHENIWLFQKIIDTYQLNITIIECDDENKIDTAIINSKLFPI
jgi:hypothetical protein